MIYQLEFQISFKMVYNHSTNWYRGISIRFFTTAVSTYRNKSSVIEYSAGGLLAGAVYKFPMGPKAVISGGLVGGLHSSIVKMLLKL